MPVHHWGGVLLPPPHHIHLDLLLLEHLGLILHVVGALNEGPPDHILRGLRVHVPDVHDNRCGLSSAIITLPVPHLTFFQFLFLFLLCCPAPALWISPDPPAPPLAPIPPAPFFLLLLTPPLDFFVLEVLEALGQVLDQPLEVPSLQPGAEGHHLARVDGHPRTVHHHAHLLQVSTADKHLNLLAFEVNHAEDVLDILEIVLSGVF